MAAPAVPRGEPISKIGAGVEGPSELAAKLQLPSAPQLAGPFACSRGGAVKRCRLSFMRRTLSERVCKTPWKSRIASRSRSPSCSTMLIECCVLCCGCLAPRAAGCVERFSMASFPLRAVMSCLMMSVSSLISSVGSAKSSSELDCASCVSLPSFSAARLSFGTAARKDLLEFICPINGHPVQRPDAAAQIHTAQIRAKAHPLAAECMCHTAAATLEESRVESLQECATPTGRASHSLQTPCGHHAPFGLAESLQSRRRKRNTQL
eukprot:1805139-Pleurochrysis_carterae.AAC.2